MPSIGVTLMARINACIHRRNMRTTLKWLQMDPFFPSPFCSDISRTTGRFICNWLRRGVERFARGRYALSAWLERLQMS